MGSKIKKKIIENKIKRKDIDNGGKGMKVKVKLVNKLKQLQEIHILKNGKDTTAYVPAGHMITLKPEEISEDIKMRLQRKFLEKR